MNAFSALSVVTGLLHTIQGNVARASLLAERTELSTEQLYAQVEAGAQLSFGMLMIILGLLLYALTKTREEQRVHITVKKPRKALRNSYWMHMKVS